MINYTSLVSSHTGSPPTPSRPSTSVVEHVSTSIIERYGIVHFVNLLLFLHEQADIINICLKTTEVLIQLLDSSEAKKRQNVIYTLTSYVKLTRILADIEEHGLNK
mmetsp:Transcript_13461/g.15633  ORF Transcript_13461/g.15633 Transcript_13461/m.15633 type:complete len:106 (-) Transcript_13461:8-325(-)